VPASVGSGPALARFTRGIGQELGRILSWALSFYVVARAGSVTTPCSATCAASTSA
jgi:hypothetical protein